MELVDTDPARERDGRRHAEKGMGAGAGEERASTRPQRPPASDGDPSAARRSRGGENGPVQPARPAGAARREPTAGSRESDADLESRRRSRDDGEDSLARRLAGAADQPDRAVCKYIVDRIDTAVGKAVQAFDERLDRLRGERDPAALGRRLGEELESGRRAFREQIEGVRDRVLKEVRDTLGDDYRMAGGSRSGHGEVAPDGTPTSAVDAAREQFRAEVDASRKEAVREVHGVLGALRSSPASRRGSWSRRLLPIRTPPAAASRRRPRGTPGPISSGRPGRSSSGTSRRRR
jgi:hypothetical protein